MGSAFSILLRHIGEIWKHFGVNQKFSIIAGLMLMLAVIGSALHWSGRPAYRLLYSGMTLEDAAAAREKIEEDKIPVQLRDSGTAIYVPAADVYKCRLKLAAAGLPKKSSSGFELFEQPKFGLTDFAQKVNYQRALQGELERTIAAMDGIASARVMLVLPSEKLFAAEAEKKASASIMLNVDGGGTVSAAQVKSIKQLVSSAVLRLSASDIAISDQMGNLLSQKSATEEGGATGAAGDQIEMQVRIDNMLTAKAQSMLDSAIGPGRSVVRVHSVLDFSQIERSRETFESDGRVAYRENITSENTSSPGGAAGGVVGVRVGAPAQVTADQSKHTSKKEDISTEYKVPSGIERSVEKGVRIKSLSVSVGVDKNAVKQEDLAGIKGLVENAVGLVNTPERQDSIQVTSIEFQKEPELASLPWWKALPIPYASLVSGTGGALLLIVIFVMTRRTITRLSIQREEVGMPVGMLAGGAGRGGEAALNGEGPLDQIARLAEQNPKAVAAWITNISRTNR